MMPITTKKLGGEVSELINCVDIEKLEDWKIEITKKFAIKTAANTRFEHYFPARQQTQEGLRPTKIYEKKHANTERLYNCPLYYMRRLLNDMTTVTQ